MESLSMDWMSGMHQAATWALVGLIWTIQLVHYPLFAQVGKEVFLEYHRAHTKRITWIVAPLMGIEIGTAAWLVWMGVREPGFLFSLVPLWFNWVSTALVQIPLHNRLAEGFDVDVHQRLVGTNWWRTVAWSVRGVCVFGLP
jgi:hypothetical protein